VVNGRSPSADRPADPIAAVTHPDPYPYYADLVAERPVARDPALGLWIVCGAAAVTAVLTDPRCLVRPPGEPVPASLMGTPGGAIFGRLVRMRDGTAHSALKPAVSAATARIEASVREHARRWAGHLATTWDVAGDPARVSEFAVVLPVYAVASVLGIAPDMLELTAGWVSDFARSIAPAATSQQLARGNAGAGHLLDTFSALHDAQSGADGPLADLRRAIARAGHGDVDDIVANGIGFLSQACEATAGLIGNTLLALGREASAGASGSGGAPLPAIVAEVVRHDPPVQNTRRFLAADAVIGSQAMKAGDAVLVVLAAANRDPTANPDPARFDPLRTERQAFTFGVGPHGCPGEAAARAIAEEGLQALLASGVRPEQFVRGVTYRPSANTRVPVFGSRGEDSRPAV
jgi:unspecific monooxygenase